MTLAGEPRILLCSHLQHVRKAIDRHPSSKLTKNYVEFEGSVKCIAWSGRVEWMGI